MEGSGLGPVNINNPTFTNCTDNLGGTDGIKTNGTWQVTFLDAANDEGIVIGDTTDEPSGHGTHSGDQIKVTIPRGGATFMSTAIPRCAITAAPTRSAPITGTYDDVNKVLFSNASFPVNGAGTCSASSSVIMGEYQVSPSLQDVS